MTHPSRREEVMTGRMNLSGSEPATADPGTRLPGEMASGASRRANVSRTVAEPILVAGEHRIELRRRDSPQLPPRLRQLVAACGAGRRMGKKRLDLLDRQRSG